MTGRIRSIDGLRGIAFLTVLLAHYVGDAPHGLRFTNGDGWLGVQLFFVLSGFLIGGILIDNRESTTLFSTFYTRRALRILPPCYTTVLVVLFIAAVIPHADWVPSSLAPLAYFTFTQNIVMAMHNVPDGVWLLPTWTLAVEEQFYLLFPLMLVVTPRRLLPAVVIACALSAPILRGAIMAVMPKNVFGVGTLLFCRWDALLIGVMVALIYRSPELFGRLTRNNCRSLMYLTLVAAWGVPITAVIDRFFGTRLFDVLGIASAAVCFGAIILMLLGGLHWRTALEAKWLQFFGMISYTAYLIHQPISVVLHGVILHGKPDIATLPQVLVTSAAAAMTIGIAWISWTAFESRIIAWGHRFEYKRAVEPVVAPGAASAI